MHPEPPLFLLGRLGPYFTVRAGDAPPPGFRPLRELYAPGPGTPLAAKFGAAARQLNTGEVRVAVSVVHLGLAARLWSVALGHAALTGAVPELDPDLAHFHLPPTGPLDLWLPPAPGAPAPDPAEELHRAVTTANLGPLAAAVRSHAPLATRLLDGNSASALAGAARMIAADPVLRQAGAARAADALVRSLLDRPPLLGTGVLAPAGPPRFRRTSCCLYYRVPGGGICGDCVFDRAPAPAAR
ncbi:(2Fe-2S)-binding protein [Kitasatospora sp. NPDC048365]|uniref:(2Fe-2S)-binding protein n=1 Tax=Kitasatospora sp. NPDC048365 TaxID=3364050 RepID=UPI0037139B73